MELNFWYVCCILGTESKDNLGWTEASEGLYPKKREEAALVQPSEKWSKDVQGNSEIV